MWVCLETVYVRGWVQYAYLWQLLFIPTSRSILSLFCFSTSPVSSLSSSSLPFSQIVSSLLARKYWVRRVHCHKPAEGNTRKSTGLHGLISPIPLYSGCLPLCWWLLGATLMSCAAGDCWGPWAYWRLYPCSKWHWAGVQAPCSDVSMSELCCERHFSKVSLRSLLIVPLKICVFHTCL